MSLNATIARLSEELAASILKAVRSASLHEIMDAGSSISSHATSPVAAAAVPTAAKAKRAGKRGRRSSDQLATVTTRILGALKGAKGGLGSEDLQKKLGLKKKDLVRPIALALAAKEIKKTGQKRATRYFSA